MRFLLDQSTDARLQTYLQGLGHDAIRVGRELPHSIPDTKVLAHATAAQRVLITDDRDFGELVFRHRQPHTGVIFLRLGPEAGLPLMTARLNYVLDHYANRLDEFLTVTQKDVRIRSQAQAA